MNPNHRCSESIGALLASTNPIGACDFPSRYAVEMVAQSRNVRDRDGRPVVDRQVRQFLHSMQHINFALPPKPTNATNAMDDRRQPAKTAANRNIPV
jgi:hypothetical protein